MGFLPPPASVFKGWSEESQTSYLGDLTAERDSHLKLADSYAADAKSHDTTARGMEMFKEDAPYKGRESLQDGTFGARIGADVVRVSEEKKRDEALANQEKELQQAQAINDQINELSDPSKKMSSIDDANEKKKYLNELNAQLQIDKDKILELRKREAELQAAIDDAYFPSITMRDEKAELEQVRAEILKVAATIAFNKKCELATKGPKTPPAPVMASSAGSPLVQKYVGMGARLQCSFGAALTLSVQRPTTMIETSPMANIMDFKPFVNIIPTGTCSAPTNPAVIAAMGSPVPCTPLIPAPWAPGKPDVLVEKFPALLSTDKCFCAYAGIIQIMP